MKLIGVLVGLLILVSSPCLADSGLSANFKVTVENLSDYDLSPGGYVVHPMAFQLFKLGQQARPAVKSLCDSGRTPDFLYYVRKDSSAGDAFSFDGGIKARSKVEAYFKATPKNGYLSFMHKISFTDDTCAGQDGISLFSTQGDPIRTEVALYPLDAGTRENLKTSPPRNEMLAQFNWRNWKSENTTPASPMALSPFLPHTPIARVTIEPIE